MSRKIVRFSRFTGPTLCSCCGAQAHEGVKITNRQLDGFYVICDDCAEAIGEQASDPTAREVVRPTEWS